MFADCIKRILDECAVTKVILVGQSLGGCFAQAFIKRYPGYVKGFVSNDCMRNFFTTAWG